MKDSRESKTFKPGGRVTRDGHVGTIKYLGPIHAHSPYVMEAKVQWDDGYQQQWWPLDLLRKA